MEIPTYWPQVLTIVITNVSVLLACFSMFLWVARQARSDHLHMDKKHEDGRREWNAVMQKHIENTDRILNTFEKRINTNEVKVAFDK
jgi:hypothetical protein